MGGGGCQWGPNRCPGSLALLGHDFVLVQMENVQNFKTVSSIAVFLKKYANCRYTIIVIQEYTDVLIELHTQFAVNMNVCEEWHR